MTTRLLILSILIFTITSFTSQTSSFKSVDAKEFEQILRTDTLQIVDVRTPEEFNQGHIQGAICMDVRNPDFDSKIIQLDKHIPVAIYCRAGRRSKIAAEKMSAIGLQGYELDNGIVSWENELTR